MQLSDYESTSAQALEPYVLYMFTHILQMNECCNSNPPFSRKTLSGFDDPQPELKTAGLFEWVNGLLSGLPCSVYLHACSSWSSQRRPHEVTSISLFCHQTRGRAISSKASTPLTSETAGHNLRARSLNDGWQKEEAQKNFIDVRCAVRTGPAEFARAFGFVNRETCTVT